MKMMMKLPLLIVLVLLLTLSCVDAKKNYAKRRSPNKKRLRGKNDQTPKPAVAKDVSAAKPEKLEEDARVGPDNTMEAEKQPETKFGTKIGKPVTIPNEHASSRTNQNEYPEPPINIPGGSSMMSNMGMYHGMGPPGLGPENGQDGDAVVTITGANAYAGFWCGPKSLGLAWVEANCNDLPICRFKRDPNGGELINELEPGQDEDCMRRCDSKDGLEDFCNEDEECYPYVTACRCPSLNQDGCEAWNV